MQKLSYTVLLIFIILIGCTSNQTKDSSSPNDVDNDVGITKLSTKESTKQDISNRTKNILQKYDEIKSVVAVNTTKKIVIGVSVHHGSRFHLKSLRKKWTKRIEKAFPDMSVKLTTDQKIIWKLTDLETKLKDKSVSKKDLQKQIKKIIKLMNETA